jgi:hypothetical protein
MSTKSINTRIYGVATDESTITGDGTTENPLTAAALGGLLYQTTLVICILSYPRLRPIYLLTQYYFWFAG